MTEWGPLLILVAILVTYGADEMHDWRQVREQVLAVINRTHDLVLEFPNDIDADLLGESAPAKGGSQNEENIVDEVAEWIDLRTHSYAAVREAAGRLTPEQIALAKAYDGGESLERLKKTDPQKTYRSGLAWIAAESHRMYQREFLALREEEQTALLDAISDEHEAANDSAHFFRRLKDDIIAGFYTSRIGLEELDDKNHGFYPESPGCPSGGQNPQKT